MKRYKTIFSHRIFRKIKHPVLTRKDLTFSQTCLQFLQRLLFIAWDTELSFYYRKS